MSTNAFAHDGHSHNAPWQACEKREKAEACEYENGNGDRFIGSCRTFNDSLMCVRNQPIIWAKSRENQEE